MAQAMRTPRAISPDEYLLLERRASFKSEYLDGQIYAIAGASPSHLRINANLSRIVGNQLLEGPCEGIGNDMKVMTSATGMFAYPDFSIVCGEMTFYDNSQDVVTNPVVIFEILSPSTERYDRSEKFARYRELDSLREYVLISQAEPRIEWYVRQEKDLWAPKMGRGLTSTASLETAGIVLPLTDFYRRVEFKTDSTDPAS